MTQQEFLQRAAQGRLHGAYLLDGEEEALKQEALTVLRRAILPEGMEELNESVLIDPETSAIIAAAETLPFLAERRLVVVRDCGFISGRREADKALQDYLAKVPDTAVVLFYVIGKANQAKGLVRAFKKAGTQITFERLKGDALNRWITDAFAAEGKQCGAAAAAQLAFISGSDTAVLRGEIAKVAAYIGDRTEVTNQDLRDVATPGAEYRVFDIVNAVVAGQSERAMRLLRDMLRAGEEPVGILGLLLRQFRLMQQTKIMQFEKIPAGEIASRLGGGYSAESIIRSARAYSGSEVRRGVQLLLDLDWKMKSGRLNEEGLAETALLSILSLKQQR